MLYDPNRNFIFIHIWKTGGKSVFEALRKNCPFYFSNRYLNKAIRLAPGVSNTAFGWRARLVNGQHFRAVDIKRNMPERRFETAFKFAFVRNPWDWQVSNYHYALESKTHGQHDIISSLGSFDAYIRFQHAQKAPTQSSFLVDENGDLLVDFVGRFERLQDDFNYVCDTVGLDAALSHLNTSKRRSDWRSYYTEETRELVADLCRPDIERFDYQWIPAATDINVTG
ncbi:MAG: sulfotransferase family 2 domain-containing protein [Pseudomonadota bacterium]